MITMKLMLLVGVILKGFEFHKEETGISLDLRKHKHQFINRVIGGFPVNIWNVSYIAAVIIKQDLQFKAACNIISRRWAVSAAHTMKSISKRLINAGLAYVRGNTSFWAGNQGFYKDHEIVTCVIPEEYLQGEYDCDIALLKVKNPFTARFERPIPIAPLKYKYREGTGAIIIGWGLTHDDIYEQPNDRLTDAPVRLLSFRSCQKMIRELTPRMLCASARVRDACIHDNGGPIVQNGLLIGIISFREVCAVERYPGIYTKIAVFYRWIMNVTNNLEKF